MAAVVEMTATTTNGSNQKGDEPGEGAPVPQPRTCRLPVAALARPGGHGPSPLPPHPLGRPGRAVGASGGSQAQGCSPNPSGPGDAGGGQGAGSQAVGLRHGLRGQRLAAWAGPKKPLRDTPACPTQGPVLTLTHCSVSHPPM